MTDRPWWATAVQWTLWAVVMTAVMGWLARSRLRTPSQAARRELAHPVATLIVGLACFLFFAALVVVSNARPNETTTWWTTAIFSGFALLALVTIADYFVAKHRLTGDGIAFRQLTGAGFIRWSELASVRYAAGMKWFRLQSRSGQVARISVMLQGLPEFARTVLAHAPEEVIEPDTVAVLEATADGCPPSIWT